MSDLERRHKAEFAHGPEPAGFDPSIDPRILAEQMRQLAYRDPLTGLLNRRGLDQSLDRVLEQLDWAEPHMVLVVFDLDHFKRVNDDYGHDAGDLVLKWVAEVLRNLLRRQSDVLARFGGEEFVVTLRATSEDEVRAALERFRMAVEGYSFPQVGRVTVSAGYTHISTSDTIPEIVGRADEALYVAKENGRNQIASYEAALTAGKVAVRDKPDNDIELF